METILNLIGYNTVKKILLFLDEHLYYERMSDVIAFLYDHTSNFYFWAMVMPLFNKHYSATYERGNTILKGWTIQGCDSWFHSEDGHIIRADFSKLTIDKETNLMYNIDTVKRGKRGK